MTLHPAVLDRPVAGVFSAVLLDLGTLVEPGGTAAPGAPELIAHLDETFTPWAVVTGADAHRARAAIDAAGLEFPLLVPRDMVAAGDPDPARYLMAADFLGAEPADCLVVEDSAGGVAAGRAAGATVAGLRGAAADIPLGSLTDVLTLLTREVSA